MELGWWWFDCSEGVLIIQRVLTLGGGILCYLPNPVYDFFTLPCGLQFWIQSKFFFTYACVEMPGIISKHNSFLSVFPSVSLCDCLCDSLHYDNHNKTDRKVICSLPKFLYFYQILGISSSELSVENYRIIYIYFLRVWEEIWSFLLTTCLCPSMEFQDFHPFL